MSKNWLMITLLFLALFAATAHAEVPIACDDSIRPKKYLPSLDFSGELPIRDYLEMISICRAPLNVEPQMIAPPDSAWLESERELYHKVLGRSKAAVLVVPFQVQGYGLDRIERAMMTADLAYALGGAGSPTVADPFLVSRALGEGERRIALNSAEALAEKLGARHIVEGFVGHDKHHTFTLTLRVREVAATPGLPSKKIWQQDWRSVPFTDEQTPAQVLHAMLPEVLPHLPLSTRPAKTDLPFTPSAPIAGSPRSVALSSGRRGVSPDLFDLFGALTASTDGRSREREFERAILAAWRGPQQDERLRFYAAYALMNLERRPGALAQLAGLNSPQGTTLRALLQGDLPAAQATVTTVKDPLERLLLQISVRDLQIKYEREPRIDLTAASDVFGKYQQAWQPFTALRAFDADPRGAPDTPAIEEALSIKQAIDDAFPIPGLDTESLQRGSVVVSAEMPTAQGIDDANVRHWRQVSDGIAVAPCCAAASWRPSGWDLIWLLEGLTESRPGKAIYRMIYLGAQMRDAIAELDQIEAVFGGNPEFAALRAAAAAGLMRGDTPMVAKVFAQQAHQSGVLAAYWAQGQSKVAERALIAAGMTEGEAGYLADAYAYDYPRRSYWPEWFLGDRTHPEQREAFTLESLAFSCDDLTPVSQLQPGQYDSVAATVGTRFTGSPRLPIAFRSVSERNAHEADPIPGLEAAIAKAPDVWWNYGGLGGILALRGDYTGAAKAYLRYPGFSNPHPTDPVAVALVANMAGTTLYLAGQWELARPLLKISADLHTGSAASLQSAQWLFNLDGRYADAATAALARGKAYGDPNAYRDYLGLLHASGLSADAWSGFSRLLAAFKSPQVWVSALVGQGREGANERAVRAWLLRSEIRAARYENRPYAAYYAVLWNSMDHLPPKDLMSLVEQIEGPPVGHITQDGVSVLILGGADLGAPLEIRPSPFRAGKTPKLPPETAVSSRLALYSAAYTALRHGDYTGSVAKFIALADRYPIEPSPYQAESYPLPYFAYAAAKTGDTVGLEAYVAGLKPNANFDIELAQAFFAGARKDITGSLAALKVAAQNMPPADDRPVIAEYQYAQACEWLYRDTRDSRFLAILVDWATRYQRIQPTYAWGYAFQYAYETDADERMRTLAMADYLDPAAEHIQRASKTDLSKARAWLKTHNPFQPPGPKTET